MKNSKLTAQPVAAPWWQTYMPYLLPALAFFLYAGTIGNGYNMDDELVTRKHKLTSKGISAIPDIFTSPYYSDDMGYSYEYRPMVLTSFAIEHQVFGDKPAVSHFFNVLLYALTVFVLFRLLRKLLHGYPYPLAVLALLLFIFHPMHTEAVASIKNRDEILALLFGLLAWTYALKYVQSGKHLLLLPIMLFFAAGLLSKASVTPLMLLIPLSTLFFFRPAALPVLLLGLGLSATAFLLTPATYPLQVLPAYGLVAVLPGLVWAVLNGKFGNIWSSLKGTGTDFVQGIRTRHEEDFALRLEKPEWNLKELLAPWFLGQVALFVGIVTAALVRQSPPLLSVGFLFFALFFYLAKTDTRKNAWLVVFTVMFVTACLLFGYSDYAEFGPLFLGTLFFMDRRFKNPVILVALLVLSIPMIYFGTFADYVLVLLVLALLLLREKFRWAKWAIWFPVTVVVVILALSVYHVALLPETAWSEFSVQLINIVLLLTVFSKTRQWAHRTVLFLVFPFFFLVNSNDVYRAYENQTKEVPQAAAPVVVSDSLSSTATLVGIPKAERPISFAEVPVTGASPMTERMGSAADVLGFYLQKMLLPYPMGYYYGFAYFKPVSITEPRPLVLLLVHIGLFVWALLAYRNHRPLSFGLLFYLFSILLFSGFLYPVVGMAGDRFVYMASFGFCLALSYLLVRYLAGKGTWPASVKLTPLFSGVVGVLLLFYGFITLIRNSQWENAITLMGNDIEYLDESAQAHNLYALNLMRESYEGKGYTPQQQFNMRKLGLTHFDRALQIWPKFFNAAYDKGRAGVSIGDFPAAIEGFEAAVAIGPEPGFMDPYYQLTELYVKTGRYSEYLVNARRIFNMEHNKHPEAYNLMAKGFYLTGNMDSAKTYLRTGMRIYPADQSLRKNMAEIFKKQGIADSAIYYGGQ